MKRSLLAIVILVVGLLFVYQLRSGEKFVSAFDDSESWVSKHWQSPLAPQGVPPESYSELEASLHPKDCGTCHEKQFKQWSTTRHSKAMGVGITSQMHSPWLDTWGQSSCQSCHAPLHEQKPFVENEEDFTVNGDYDPKLQSSGVVCAACHLRNHKRYGPTPRDGSLPDEDSPHGGFTVVEDFNRSEFCASCHQFKKDQLRVNGKLIEDTYNQWKRSPAATEGRQCASCHMPDREHSWKGIHSPEMVKSGLTITLKPDAKSVVLSMVNSGVGHKFPTYVTPQVIITGWSVDKDGLQVGDVQEEGIGWSISLDLQEEYYDTRLDPGEEFLMRFKLPERGEAVSFVVQVKVYPDEFYNRFYKALLEEETEGIDRAEMVKALKESEESSFVIFEKRLPLI